MIQTLVCIDNSDRVSNNLIMHLCEVTPGVALRFRSRQITINFHAGSLEYINETNRSTSMFSVVRENSSLSFEIICRLFGFLRCSRIMRCGFMRSSFGFGVNDFTEHKRSENKCQRQFIAMTLMLRSS